MTSKLLHFQPELQAMEAVINQATAFSNDLATQGATYATRQSGKYLRPRLLLLALRARAPFSAKTSPEDEPAIRTAACVELLHTASLLHDDVIDHAQERRGRASLNAQYGDNVAILVADLLFAQAFEVIRPLRNYDLIELLGETTRKMCQSELEQIAKKDQILSEQEYLSIIEGKTACLFAACTRFGALLRKSAPEEANALAAFGHNLGMAFQIVDDTLDYTATSENWGKDRGNDLAQGKQTLPLIHTISQASPSDRNQILKEMRNGRQIHNILPVIHQYGGLDYAESKARNYAEKARELIAHFAPKAAAPHFEAICAFACERDH